MTHSHVWHDSSKWGPLDSCLGHDFTWLYLTLLDFTWLNLTLLHLTLSLYCLTSLSHFTLSLHSLTLIERNPPSRRGFLCTVFPHQEPCVRGPPSKDLYQDPRGGSSYSRFLMREHSKQETPPGGGGFFRSTWLSHLTLSLDLTCSHVWHNSTFIHMCDMTHWHEGRDSHLQNEVVDNGARGRIFQISEP